MANGNGNGKWKMVLWKVVGGIVSVAIISNATFTYNTLVRLAVIETNQATATATIKGLTDEIKDLTALIAAKNSKDALQDDRIANRKEATTNLKKDLEKHIDRTGP